MKASAGPHAHGAAQRQVPRLADTSVPMPCRLTGHHRRLACLDHGYTDHSRQEGLESAVVQPSPGSKTDGQTKHECPPLRPNQSARWRILGRWIACAKHRPAPVPHPRGVRVMAAAAAANRMIATPACCLRGSS